MRILVKLFLLLSVMTACKAQAPKLAEQPDGNTLLWEVTGKGLRQPTYLFGTFHLMCKQDIQFSPALKEAFKYSKIIYMELDMDDPATMLGALTQMNMKDGKKLKDLYTPAEWERLSSYFTDTLHTPLTLFGSAKPALLEAMLYPKMMPCKTPSGVEDQLAKLAKEQKKEILGLETMELQMAVFDKIPYEEQAQDLLKAIDSLQQYKVHFAEMVEAYKSQQMPALEKVISDSAFGTVDNQDELLDKRNLNWVVQLKKLMKKKSLFVAVGAGHLVGRMGLVSLLRKEGYTVRPLKN